MRQYGFADVLSVEAMLAQLAQWQYTPWIEFAGNLRSWSAALFDFLIDPHSTPVK